MIKNKINKYKKYKEILVLCKIIKIIDYLDEQVENKLPTYQSNEKVKKFTKFS